MHWAVGKDEELGDCGSAAAMGQAWNPCGAFAQTQTPMFLPRGLPNVIVKGPAHR